MSAVGEMVGDGLDAVDRGLLPWLYARASVDPAVERARWAQRGLAHVGAPGGPPSAVQLARTLDGIVDDAARAAGTTGALAGLAGAVGIPTEAAAWAVEVVRAVQRMAIALGVDPAGARGRVLVARALAEGLEIAVPDSGPEDARLTGLVRGHGVRTAFARSVAARAGWLVSSRAVRWVPGVAAVHAAIDTPRRTRAVLARARAVLWRAASGPSVVAPVEATEVASPAGPRSAS